LRELTRYRSTFIKERATLVNRVHKVLESANIKLTSVATDVIGVSGRAILQALLEGKSTPEEMAGLAKGRMREKREQLTKALEGRVKAHHRFVLTELLCQVDSVGVRPSGVLTNRSSSTATLLKDWWNCWTPLPQGSSANCRNHSIRDWRRYEPVPFCKSSCFLGWSVSWKQ